MNAKRILLLVALLLGSAVFGGLVMQEAKAQQYQVSVDFALQTSSFLGQDITVLGRITVLSALPASDTITAALVSPDQGTVTSDVFIPVTAMTGDEFPFDIAHFTFTAGEFNLVLTSALLGSPIHQDSFPVPNYPVSVGISTTAGELGTQFLVVTTIGIGNMTIVFTRYDVRYVLDGVPLTRSETVVLVDPTFLVLTGLPAMEGYSEWHIVQPFTLSQGSHTLSVEVVDLSLVTEDGGPVIVASSLFSISVTDQVQALEQQLDETTAAVDTRLTDLEGRTENVERTSATTSPLAFLSIAAIALAAITLLIQFGILKLGRLRRGGGGEQEGSGGEQE